MVAVTIGVAATTPLEVPPEIDHYRDMGAAEAILAGQWGHDPALLGETAWYPPLLPLVMATLGRVTALPLTTLYVHAGPLLNAAAPVAFYVLARHLFGGWTAVLSLVGFLFAINSATTSWAQACYSPWVWPVLFAQTFYYLTLKAWLEASEKPSVGRSCLAGVLLGLTFLAHPAPAVLLVVTMVLLSVFQALATPARCRSIVQHLLAIGAVSAVVCAPFLVPLVTRYGLNTQNPVPSRFGGVWLSDVARSHLSLRTVGALAALGWLWCRMQASRMRLQDWSVLTAWALAGGGLIYGIAAQKLELRGVQVPLLFPTFHFHFYVLAMEALLFGPGLVWLAQSLIKHAPFGPVPSAVHSKQWIAPLTVLVLVVAELPSYRARDDFTHWPEESREFARDATLRSVYDWARRELGPRDVVLASTRLGMYAVVASGHCILSTYPSMTNPYVAIESREAARQTMFEHLRARDFAAFASLAAEYGITYVVAEVTDEPCCALNPIDSPYFRVRHRAPKAIVYEFLGTSVPYPQAHYGSVQCPAFPE
ncbi:MAG: hypothetical protein ACM3ZE_13610 [Myxococcales bacterium]